MSEPVTPKSLATKLAEVMGAVGRIPKRGRNSFHGYDYATEADIAEAIRSELASRLVMLIPSVEAFEVRELVSKKAEKDSRWLTFLTMTFTFKDGESGETIEKKWLGAGEDSGDKGVYKAMTGAEKYFLMKTFLMPTGDDPEHESKDEKHDKATVKPSAPEKKARPPLPDGAVYIDRVVPRSKGNREWAEVLVSTGEELIVTTPQLITLAVELAQEGGPVVISAHVNSKGKTAIDMINRWGTTMEEPAPVRELTADQIF